MKRNNVLRFCQEKEKASLLVKVHIIRITYTDIVFMLRLHNGCIAKIKF